MFSKSNSIKKFKKHPVLIAPNLGKPQIISFPGNSKDNTDIFRVELLYIANYNMSVQNIQMEIEESINLRPIIDFDAEKGKGIRGESITGKIIKVTNAPIIPLSDPELVYNYNHESPRGIPIKEGIYDEKNSYFLAICEFKFTKTLKSVIDREGFIMCDLHQTFMGEKNINKLNFHSVVLTDQTWEDFTIVHATDLHIAKRNDEVLGVILKNMEKGISKGISKVVDLFSKKGTKNSKTGLRDRFINPNNNLRLFIKVINYFKKQRMADVIVFTGDIVDYCIKSDGGDTVETFDLPNTNWDVFLNIILNQPLTYRSDIKGVDIYPGEELMIPIFTTVGNHDYHPYHYNLRWFTFHKFVNLTQFEILHYKDLITANPLTALYSNRKTLMGYNQYINPYQNYYVKLGDHLLLILDSGWDSLKATKDLLSGSPSLTGFSEDQLKFLENIIKNKAGSRGMRMAFFHAPLINPMPLKSMKTKLRKQFKKVGFSSLDDFKEENLKEKEEGESRSDYYLKYNYGTITNNWEKTVKILNDNKFLTINGHTHQFFESRTEKTDATSEFSASKYIITKEKMEVPAAVFMDDYSLKYKNSDFFMKKFPFQLQTPSLGPGTYGENIKRDTGNFRGPFRIIKIKNNVLNSFSVDFVSNYLHLLPELFQ
ncbi:MAG: metallophosphoesterase [Promethearchaeota archaeon]